uniref:Uncharacterized protein n=2 Tax=Meloidogyne TaxID=189290 RepID=A0A6V7YB96_MELEN|nr:unnamed protein product [Meloidogyne enterolobii]CAD2208801.1 unnamed protein product [Meloidogyne enterolobii]
MANKFVLVPQDIYRGLTTYDTGDPNIDFARREVEGTKRKNNRSSVKNILYNQELRRYLSMRNERENRPVKVELVASPKGAIMNQNLAHPSTNINENDDDLWMSDDLSFSSYPTQPPNRAYNLVPPPSIPSSEQNFEAPQLPSPPISPTQPSTSKPEYFINSKRLRNVSKNIKKSKKPKKKGKARYSSYIENESNTNENTPLNPPTNENIPLTPPPIPLQTKKREQDSNNNEGVKRIKNTYENKELMARQIETAQSQKRKELLQRRKAAQNVKVPLDHGVLQQIRRDEVENLLNRANKSRQRYRIIRDGRSPSPPISRQLFKRKREGSPEREEKRMRRTVSKSQSERAGRLWAKNLIKARRKEANSSRFKPSLW